MSNITHPYTATGEDGQTYSPYQAKAVDQRYYLTSFGTPNNRIPGLEPQEVIPVTPDVATEHWRLKSEDTFPGYGGISRGNTTGVEMGWWHVHQQRRAMLDGCNLEVPIDIGGKLYRVDAVDDKGTLIEFVDTHEDDKKIHDYFDAGYNQKWVFKSTKSPGYAYASKIKYQLKMAQEVLATLGDFTIPTIEVTVEAI